MRTLKEFIEDGERHLSSIQDPTERQQAADALYAEFSRQTMAVSEEEAENDPEEGRDASDMAEEGCCYSDEDGERNPRIKGLMPSPLSIEWGQQFTGAPDVRVMPRGIVDAPQAPDAVDYGQIEDQRREENKEGRPAYRGGSFARMGFRVGRSRGENVIRSVAQKECLLCGEKFPGGKDANFCPPHRAREYQAARKRARELQK